MEQGKSRSFALRIEAHLVDPLQKLKKQNRRSMNSEINAALDAWVAGLPASDAVTTATEGSMLAAKERAKTPRKKLKTTEAIATAAAPEAPSS
ncbi:MAG: hypothetical protein ACRDHX_16240 [Chloroflexota bacterium]